jgi:hypothetical protein
MCACVHMCTCVHECGANRCRGQKTLKNIWKNCLILIIILEQSIKDYSLGPHLKQLEMYDKNSNIYSKGIQLYENPQLQKTIIP